MIKLLRNPYFKLLASARLMSKSLTTKKHLIQGEKLIISLTSYPPRFPALHLTIKTLLSQSVQPDHIFLWIYEPELELLPEKVKKLQNEIFQIKTVSKNLRSFTKLIPSFKQFPNAYIATADDDTYYPANWLETLTGNIQPNEKIVVGHQAHEILVDENKRLLPYNSWKSSTNLNHAAKNIFLLTGPGVLFPPNSLPTAAFDDEKFLSVCASADDVWFYFMLRLNGYQFKKVGQNSKFYTWKGSQKVGLYHLNVYENMNDVCIQNMMNEFGNPLDL